MWIRVYSSRSSLNKANTHRSHHISKGGEQEVVVLLWLRLLQTRKVQKRGRCTRVRIHRRVQVQQRGHGLYLAFYYAIFLTTT